MSGLRWLVPKAEGKPSAEIRRKKGERHVRCQAAGCPEASSFRLIHWRWSARSGGWTPVVRLGCFGHARAFAKRQQIDLPAAPTDTDIDDD